MQNVHSRILSRLSPWIFGLALLGAASDATAVDVTCGTEGGDGFGWSVASGKDFDGDQVADVAVGAPCATVKGKSQAGRVRVYSGASGRRILSLAGSDVVQRFGAALEFVADLNGDGRAELAIGSPNFKVPQDGGGTLANGGKLEVFSSGGGVVWTFHGKTAEARVGETVASLADVTGDSKAEVVVGGSEASIGTGRRGIGYLLSGANGAVLAQSVGVRNFDFWGSIVAAPGDIDGDQVEDWVVASNAADAVPAAAEVPALETTTTTMMTTTTTTTTTTLVKDVGRVSFLSGQAGYPEVTELQGLQPGGRLGRSVAGLSDQNGDEIRDVAIGAPGFLTNGLNSSGRVTIFTGFGDVVRHVVEPVPQEFAGFGTTVCSAGSLDGGTEDDLLASAPLAKVSGLADAGRVHAFDGADGSVIWTQIGDFQSSRFGQSLAGGPDFDGDDVPDVVVGAPGDAPNGRRGAGAAHLLSGADGEVIATFGGRRGRETRLFVAGPGLGRVPTVRSFDPFGRRREVEIRPFRSQRASQLSMAILEDGDGADGNKVLVAIGAGPGGASPDVAVYRAGRRRLRMSFFAAGQSGYAGGLNVASGDFSADSGEEIAAVAADDAGATTNVVLHARDILPEPTRIVWKKLIGREFPVFSATDEIDGLSIGAKGAFIAVGDLLTNSSRDEIVAAPVAGLPVVRVFSGTGTRLAEWRAYSAQGPGVNPNSGTSIALGDLDGNGTLEIVTAPAFGQLLVRAWQANGDPWLYDTENELPVNFQVFQYGPLFEGGLRLATADVDLDGAAEILVAPGAGVEGVILAFEPDGTPVEGWEPFSPFGPLGNKGLTLLGTDQFWRP